MSGGSQLDEEWEREVRAKVRAQVRERNEGCLKKFKK